MKTYKAIFLDWDDTIGDWSHAAHEALCDVYRLYGLASMYPTEEDFIATYEPYNLGLWDKYGRGEITKDYLRVERFRHVIANEHGTISKGDMSIEELAMRMGEDFLRQTNTHFSLLPHAEEVVRYLADKYPLTIISNGFKEIQHYKFEHSGLVECFAHILISEEVGVNKPQPEIFEKALTLNGVRRDEALMIGDSLTSDIAGAENAGIDSIWIRGSKKDECTVYEGCRKVSDIREIMKVL